MIERKRLGRSEIMLPTIGLGTGFTGIPSSRQTLPENVDGNPVDEALGLQTLLAAIDAGYRFFDTAVLYGQTLSEKMIGEALRQRPDLAGDILVTTKAGRWHYHFDFSYDGVLRSVDDSLERLGLDRLELVYIHDAMGQPMEAIMSDKGALGALRTLQKRGIVKSVGIACNDPATNLPFIQTGAFDAAVIADSCSLINLTAERGIFQAAAAHDTGLVVATPLERGLLVTGPIAEAHYLNRYFPPECLAQVSQIQRLCADYDIPMLAAALQWVVRQPQVASTIPGARIPDEAIASFNAMQVDIPERFWDDLQPLIRHFHTRTGD